MGYLDLAGLQYLWDKLKEKFASKSHSHDDRYYTEAEMDGKLNGKVNNNEAGANGLINKLSTADGTPNDATVFISQHNDGKTASYYRRPISTLWTYIKNKADSVYQPKGSYAASSHSHDDRYYTESEVDGKLGGKVDNTEAGADGLLSKLTTSWTATPTDDTYFIRQDINGGNQFGRVKFSTIWAYIRGKTDGIYQPKGSYAASNHSHTKDQVGLGNVDNTADASKSVKYAANAGSANGVIPEWSGSVNLKNSSWLAAWSSDGKKIKAMSTGTFATAGHTHSSIDSVGIKNAQTGRNQAYGNVYSYNSNNSAHEGMPTTYASTIGFGRGSAGTVEICGEWTGGKGLWSRALRDYQDNWYNWQRIYTENYHPNADTAKSVA